MRDMCVRGIFRSGTNFLKATIELNYEVRVKYDTYGWKHYFFPVINEGSRASYPLDPCVFIARNPYLALESLHRYFKSNKRNLVSECSTSLSTFLKNELIIKDGGSIKSSHLWFPNPVVMWCQINHNAATASSALGDRSRFIKYEDLVDETEETVSSIMKGFGIPGRNKNFIVPDSRTKNLGENNHKASDFFTGAKFDRGAVRLENILKSFTGDDMSFIRRSIPAHIGEALGYCIL